MAIQAYGLKPYRVRPPARTDTYRFNVEAKVPPGATADQVKAMLRNLLTERFKLAFHYEKTETQAYALVVAKGGLKIKESAPPSPVAAPSGGAAQTKARTGHRRGRVYLLPSARRHGSRSRERPHPLGGKECPDGASGRVVQ